MPIITMTADTFLIQHEHHEKLEPRRPVSQLRGRGTITQQGDELSRVDFDLVEFARNGPTSPREFQGSLVLTGGVPLDVGLPNLILDLSNGRHVAIEVTSLSRTERHEIYGVRGRLTRPSDG